jgi:hypothetical protein
MRPRYPGRVTAGKKKCARLRKLGLFEKRDGPDFKLGTSFSDTLGYWSINSSSENLDTATVYAKAPKAKRGNVLCKPGPLAAADAHLEPVELAQDLDCLST